jgi:F-type H+-transporting ATPase subunit gamma
MDTLESLRTKLESAADIDAVVKTMKAVAASNIGQYEKSVAALEDYYRTVSMGLSIYFKSQKINAANEQRATSKVKDSLIGVIVFGSDQGLVGRFNDSLTDFVSQSLNALPNRKEVWAVGERIQLLLKDIGFNTTKTFSVPNEVKGITSLIGDILIKAQQSMEQQGVDTLYIFHNHPTEGAGYIPVMKRLLPLDAIWQQEFDKLKWPTNNLPQVAGSVKPTLLALISEYLFVSLFKACAESLASENASRLKAMQRAEKNIDELLEDLNNTFHRLRQSSIDEELFDVVSGFEALKDT